MQLQLRKLNGDLVVILPSELTSSSRGVLETALMPKLLEAA